MEREIKFRYYDSQIKCMLQPSAVGIYGWYAEDRDFEDGKSQPFERLMQFTGLLDKNGKEIYEGDICRVLYTDWPSKDSEDPRSIEKYKSDISKIGSVEMEDYEWQFNFGNNRYGEINYGTFHVGAHGRIEVIGNIYENPELLNQNKS